MVKLVRGVASVVRDLETLGLIQADSVSTVVKWDGREGPSINVSFRTAYNCVALCQMMFAEISEEGGEIAKVIISGKNNEHMTYKFRKTTKT